MKFLSQECYQTYYLRNFEVTKRTFESDTWTFVKLLENIEILSLRTSFASEIEEEQLSTRYEYRKDFCVGIRDFSVIQQARIISTITGFL